VKIGQEWMDAALNGWMYLPWPHFPNLDDAIKTAFLSCWGTTQLQYGQEK
jgi:hypothetical protein